MGSVEEENFEKLDNFLNGVGAARMLLQRCYEKGFLIEALVLYSSLIDGLCRMAIILKQQIIEKSDNFNLRYIYQDESGNYYSERKIYKIAKERRIIDEDLYKEIDSLYDFRNKIIHRFVISEVEYSHLELVLDRYELAYQRLYNIVYSLESEQIHKNVGMTILGEKGDSREIIENIFKKIDTKDEKKLEKILGSKIIQDSAAFSKRGERERVSDEIRDEVDIREEKEKIPPGFTSVKEITKWAERKGFFNQCDNCEHEKIHHVDQVKIKKGADDFMGRCSVAGCECIKYLNKS